MQSVRVYFNYRFDAFHRFRSQSSKLLVAYTQHHIFKGLKQVSHLCLNIKESDDISYICNIDHVASSYPCLVFLKYAPIFYLIEFILTLKFILFVIMQMLLVEGLLSGKNEGKTVTESEVAWLVLIVKLLDLLMESVELVIVQKFRRYFAV